MNAAALLRALTPERASFVRLARRRLGSNADAEDAVQRAMLKASTHAETLQDPARARAWFYRILRREIIDHHRARGPATEPIVDEPLAPDEPVEHACACATHLLRELRPAYADVLRAIDFEGREPAAVAAELGISIENVHVRIFRARRALRAKVGAHCGVERVEPCLDCTCDAGRCCGGERTPPPVGESTMKPQEATARAYLDAFYRGDVAEARKHLADDLAFDGPAAKLRGAESFLRAAAHVAPGVRTIDVRRVFVDGDDVAVFYDLVLDERFGRVPVAEHQHHRQGRIDSIQLLLDTAIFTRPPKGDLVVDPVCGMRIAKSAAVATRERAGLTYHFCNAGCAETFDREPQRFAAR